MRRLLVGSQSESQVTATMIELESIVPDPRVSNLIYWPSRHPLSQGLNDAELTPEKIVELAYRYKPFAL